MPQFVILEHRWNGVHFDFMVESPGENRPLRTWAIDVESFEQLRSGLTLPARSLPDHRREYLTYEGPISGDRGHVTRCDEGVCEVICWEHQGVSLRVHGRQLDGLVELAESASDGSGTGGNVSGIASASIAGGGSTTCWFFSFGKLR